MAGRFFAAKDGPPCVRRIDPSRLRIRRSHMAERRIDHLVLLMLENRSFDHIFGFRPGVNGLTGNESNLPEPSHAESPANPAFRVSDTAPFAVPVGNGPL